MNYSVLFAEDKRIIQIRPSLVSIAGSFLGGAILGQIIYWWDKSDGKPFFKFKEPCQHQLYRSGDSWYEELGFISAERFDTALKKLEETGIVSHKTTINRLTYYNLDEAVLNAKLEAFYSAQSVRFTLTGKDGIAQTGKDGVVLNTETTHRLSTPIAPISGGMCDPSEEVETQEMRPPRYFDDSTPGLFEDDPPINKKDVNQNGKKGQKEEDRAMLQARGIYEAYPRHVGLGVALKAITKALKDNPFDEIMEGVKAYKKATDTWSKQDRQFIPHPSSWINGMRWKDDRSTWERKSDAQSEMENGWGSF